MVKKKIRKFSASKAVKAAAREQIGSPAPTRAIPVKNRAEGQKHRPTLGKLLNTQD